MTQLRLILAGLMLIAFLALGSTALWYRGQAISAQAQAAQARAALDTAVAANKAQQAAIARQKADEARNNQITAELMENLAAANAAIMDLTTSRNSLKDADATVRDYLRTPVPAPLKRLYDR